MDRQRNLPSTGQSCARLKPGAPNLGGTQLTSQVHQQGARVGELPRLRLELSEVMG